MASGKVQRFEDVEISINDNRIEFSDPNHPLRCVKSMNVICISGLAKALKALPAANLTILNIPVNYSPCIRTFCGYAKRASDGKIFVIEASPTGSINLDHGGDFNIDDEFRISVSFVFDR